MRGAAWSQVTRPVPLERYCPSQHQPSSGRLALLPGNIESRNVITASIEDSLLLHHRLLELAGRLMWC